MTEPVAPTPSPAKRPWGARVFALVRWATSPEGRKDIGAAVALITAIYTALHRAGV